MTQAGKIIYENIKKIYDYPRSLTGEGVRKTLRYIQTECPELKILATPSGSKVFDWEVPQEWLYRNAYVADMSGKIVIDVNDNFLHLVGYSQPIDSLVSLAEFRSHLHFIKDQPDAIPYVTSYYGKNWGFCCSYKQYKELNDDYYYVKIDTSHFDGELNYGELILPGKMEKEVFLSSYVCHPNMANNELSGPVILLELAKYLSSLPERKYTYRLIWVPETIGAINYLHKKIDILRENMFMGFVLTCLGDNNEFSFVPSRLGSTVADRTALRIFKNLNLNFKRYSFLDRGSDERQYCHAGVDLPVVSITRSKYGTYPEYHTHLDDLNFISEEGLNTSFEYFCKLIDHVENNDYPVVSFLCEPMLGKRGMYNSLSKVGSAVSSQNLLNCIAYCDGSNSIYDLAEILSLSVSEVREIVEQLINLDLIKKE